MHLKLRRRKMGKFTVIDLEGARARFRQTDTPPEPEWAVWEEVAEDAVEPAPDVREGAHGASSASDDDGGLMLPSPN
jgi:hypothetical protein